MAFKLVGHAGGQTEASFVNTYGTGVINIGDAVIRKTGIGVIAANDNTNGSVNIYSLFGVASSAMNSTSTTLINVIPIVPGQLWEADCNANSNENQILCRNTLTSASVLNNSSTDTDTSLAVFLIHRKLGATSDKKVIGEFIRVNGGKTAG